MKKEFIQLKVYANWFFQQFTAAAKFYVYLIYLVLPDLVTINKFVI